MRSIGSAGFGGQLLRLVIAVAGLAMLSTVGSGPAAVAAIPDAIAQKPVSVNVQQASVVTVLRSLFKSAGVNFSIDSDVRGSDTISLSNVTFEAALRSILHANIPKLAYDYHDGVVHVSMAKAAAPAIPTPTTTASTDSGTYSSGRNAALSSSGAHYYKLPVDHYDVAMMAMLLRMSASKTVSLVPSDGMSGMGSGTGSMGMSGMSGTSGMRSGSMGTMGTGMGMSTGMGMGGNTYGGYR